MERLSAVHQQPQTSHAVLNHFFLKKNVRKHESRCIKIKQLNKTDMKNYNSKTFSMKDASKWGIAKFGYIKDFAGQLVRFNHLLEGTGVSLTRSQLDSHVDGLEPVYWDYKGHDRFQGKPIEERFRAYKVIKTGYKTAAGEDIYGMFVKNVKFGSWEGVVWGTYRSLRKEMTLLTMPKIGPIVFMTKEQRNEFLASIASRAIPEPWSFGPASGQEEYPILRSYLENTFVKLQKEVAAGKEHKIIYSSDGTHILFNTNLPDTFGNDILILADVKRKANGEEYYENPRMSTDGIRGRRQLGFADDAVPEPASFFEDVNEVIFQSSWKIDDSFDHLDHIIQDNRSRFPKAYQGKAAEDVAQDLEKAIRMAVRMAKRNFKYIAPMYRPQQDRIQLLMPIYLSARYNKTPDFAMVLTPEGGIYVPETILPIKGAYQNARLIAMPDEAWLRPETLVAADDPDAA